MNLQQQFRWVCQKENVRRAYREREQVEVSTPGVVKSGRGPQTVVLWTLVSTTLFSRLPRLMTAYIEEKRE